MKRSIIFSVMAWCLALAPLPKPALAQPEPVGGTTWTAESNAGPAFEGTLAAWRGAGAAERVWYSIFETCGGPGCSGPFGWVEQQPIPGTATSAAPALSSIGPYPFVAFKGQAIPSDKIYYSIMTGSTFPGAPNPTICNTSGTCAQTIAAPAAAANGYTMYVAWTTAADTIQLATYTPTGGTPYGTVGTWSISPSAVPGALTTTAPALAVFKGALFLAWVAEGTTEVKYATMPLSGGSWIVPAAVSGSGWTAQSPVAPALGVFTTPATKLTPGGSSSLYLAWTTPMVEQQNTIKIAQWNASSWVEWNPPIPIPPGPLTVLTPSLFEIQFPPFVACDVGYYYFYIGYTALNGNLYYSELESVTTPPVNVKGCVPQ